MRIIYTFEVVNLSFVVYINESIFILLGSEQCDWPYAVDCNFRLEKIKQRKLSQPTYLYLTFDDGPNEGTPNVLRALQVNNYAKICS